jgi:hypothetical protein
MRLAVFVSAVTPSDSPLASHLPQEEGFGLRRFASERRWGLASLGEGGVARRSRVTEGVGAESGREMRLAVFVTAATPSDSPSASHLPQEEGFDRVNKVVMTHRRLSFRPSPDKAKIEPQVGQIQVGRMRAEVCEKGKGERGRLARMICPLPA